MGSISHHITPLVIDSLGGGHTHKQTYRSSRTEAILRNQARAGLRPACAWFKNCKIWLKFCKKIILQFFLQVLARSVQNVSILARKASFLMQILQDLMQDLASLARKILARLAYFLQDGFYWVSIRQRASVTKVGVVDVDVHVLSHLKEELQLWVISTIMLFKKQ